MQKENHPRQGLGQRKRSKHDILQERRKKTKKPPRKKHQNNKRTDQETSIGWYFDIPEEDQEQQTDQPEEEARQDPSDILPCEDQEMQQHKTQRRKNKLDIKGMQNTQPGGEKAKNAR